MKRKEYKKPTMQIVMLKNAQPLLVGSSSDIPGSDPYTPDGDPLSF